jgi:chromosome partitioning protein
MNKIITFSIFKGGTGKTTTAVNLASALTKKSTNALLVDLDQQASATRHLGIHPEDFKDTLFHVFLRKMPISLVVQQTDFGFDLIPGHPLLAALETALETGDEEMLKSKLEGIKPEYDYILIDTPPGKGRLSSSALTAADEVIIPLQAQRPALDGTADILNFIQHKVWDKYNPDLEILGILPTMVRRTTSHSRGVIKKARELWGDKVFNVEIPTTVAFPRSFDNGKPLLDFDPDHEATKLFITLAETINNERR